MRLNEYNATLPLPRKGEWQLRRSCPIAMTHQDADDPVCAWTDCIPGKAGHRLRLRRMLICSECEQGYFTPAEFAEHECYSAY